MKDKASMLFAFRDLFPSSNVSKETIMAYATYLDTAGFPTPLLRLAMEQLLKKGPFFPSISEIMETSREIMESVGIIPHEPDVDEAWGEVFQEMNRVSIYGKPQFSTAEIALAVRRMGWSALCNIRAWDVNTARAQFRDIYNSIIKRKREKQDAAELLLKMSDAVPAIAKFAEMTVTESLEPSRVPSRVASSGGSGDDDPMDGAA